MCSVHHINPCVCRCVVQTTCKYEFISFPFFRSHSFHSHLPNTWTKKILRYNLDETYSTIIHCRKNVQKGVNRALFCFLSHFKYSFFRVCSFIYSQFSSSSHSLLLFFSPRSLKWMSWFQNSVQRNKKKIIIWKLHKHKLVSFFFFCSSIHEKGTRFEKKQKKY